MRFARPQNSPSPSVDLFGSAMNHSITLQFVGREPARSCDDDRLMIQSRFPRALRALIWASVAAIVAGAAVRLPIRRWYGESVYARRTGIRGVIRVADRLPYRSSAARLAGGFAYRPLETAKPRGGTESSKRRIYVAADGSAIEVGGRPAPANVHGEGVAQLIAGNADNALPLLERAAADDANDPAVLSDLAAACYAVGDRDERTELILRAIDLSARASAIDPTLAAAAFNRALATESILTRSQSVQAWNDYLRLDADSGWASEARDHVQKLSRIVDASTDKPEELAARIEEKLLPAWADAFRSGNLSAADAALRSAQTSADSLQHCCSDDLHRSAVDIVSGAVAGNAPSAARLAVAHQQYRDARDLYAHNQTSAALPLFAATRDAFRNANDPFALKPWKYLAASHLYLGDAKRALSELNDAVGFCASFGYTAAALGHLRWAQAIASGRAGDPQRALELYAQALEAFEKGNEEQNAASVHALIAENLEFLGWGEEAWPHRRIALRSAEENRTLDRVFIAFNEAADAALRRGHVVPARLFQDVVVAAARREKNTLMLANSLFWRGRISHAANDDASAQRDFDEAEALARAVPDAERRTQLSAGIAAARAEASGPARAIDYLTTAIRYFEVAANHYRLAELYAARAEVEEKQALRDLAEADFNRCIRELESERSGIAAPALRQRYFAQGSEVFDRAIRHLWMGGRRDDAFALAERSRGREVAGRETPAPAALRALPAMIRQDDALVEYALLGDRTLIWIVRPAGVIALETPATAGEVAGAVAALQTAFEQRDGIDHAMRRVAALVYDPIAAQVKDAKRLVVIANKSLRAVPFSAVRDPLTNRYVIQDREIVTAPSATAYARSLRRDRSLPRPDQPSLMLASYTSADPGRHLAALVAGRREIKTIRALYSRAEVLGEDAATPPRVLASASTATAVHIVAHALENAAHPEFSSVALAPASAGRDLYANTIAAAPFRSTRLVFLSACGTPGQNAHNDPPLTLPESFLAAGVPMVIGAIRPVDDEAAAAFAVAFHRAFAMSGDPVAALRRAQLECLASPKCSDPGEWSLWIAIGGTA
jgi:CHAT domain-containing protein/tetratricopeptide (TPR) repeat protein